MDYAFKIERLEKKYSDFKLGPLDLDLEPGMVMGYIGPNGSGKTTTLLCMMQLIKANSGSIKIFGTENAPNNTSWKFDIGYVSDSPVFYENWNGEKNLKFLSQFYPNWSDDYAMALAKRFNIDLTKKAKDLSRGNRVKLSLISALSHKPKLLLLDEPTSGLDPVVRAEVLDTLFEVVETGERSIFYSTHILSDISRLADDLAFLKDGKLLFKTAKDDLIEKWRKISFKYNGELRVKNLVSKKNEGNDYQIITSDFSDTIEKLTELEVENLNEHRMSIDEIAVEVLKG
ncbi:MAG: ABC transporter ATP-binding protein [Melioribacteraceae bacterium]|nr:ABC transporter ATP-binding protein [Melioribacteraceae bacterium]